jgi:RNA polymerase sigma-70 factor (ECF subfamily)
VAADAPAPPAPAPAPDAALLAALRRGEEAAFAFLVERDHAVLVGVAYGFVRNRAIAEEVAQESWLAFLQGIDRFEGRASVRTFVCAIVANKARTRAQREARSIPMSALEARGGDPRAGERLLERERDRVPSGWSAASARHADSPERRLLGSETMDVLQAAIAVLPERQRRVLVLRDVHGLSSAQACAALGLTEGNQRVLLHRARVRIRSVVGDYVAGTIAA